MHNRYREEEKECSTSEELNNSSEDVLEKEPEVIVEDVGELKENERILALEAEVKKLNDLYLRTLAEADNYKKRINEERIRERKYASQGLLEKLVTSLDVFDKVINIKTDDEKLKNFLIGFEMINNQFKQIIGDEGVKKIESLNKKFDPSVHHAVETMWDEKVEEDVILEEFQSGYTYKDRVLRPALVKVNKKIN